MKKVWYKYREERGTASSFWTTPNNLLRNSNTGKRDFTEFKIWRKNGTCLELSLRLVPGWARFWPGYAS
ncbi:hypothetical protein PBY51_008590 [Eleginops maclovinus]|uniref:Uncharacterized protein n=1 Tax=Eleginops maclovinus TaxID=56733 RepID=A0AAN7WV51_ELEMC|nr:hypothetical protein PBY51_008590 [Eleginops maclovinus]